MYKKVMKQYSIVSAIVSLSILMFFYSSSYAKTPVFGPEVYVRDTGKPQKVTNPPGTK